MYEIDIDIDTEIINYIAENSFVRTGQLIDHFARKSSKRENNNENGDELYLKTDEEKKKSKRTIQRRLEKMKKMGGPIVVPTPEQLKRYGIEDPDGRAKYLTLRETIERDKDLDKIINLLITGDDIDKKMVLREIDRCKRYVLLPNQLDALVLNLDNKDAELIEGFLRVLHQYITKKEIKPENKKVLLEKLKKLLKEYPEGHKEYTMIRTYVIWLLGDYDDNTVIGQLIEDSEKGILSKFKKDYFDWTTAKLIKKERKKLFDVENKLRRKGDTENADILADIRDTAEMMPEKPKELDELFKSGVCEIGDEPNMVALKKYFDKQQK